MYTRTSVSALYLFSTLAKCPLTCTGKYLVTSTVGKVPPTYQALQPPPAVPKFQSTGHLSEFCSRWTLTPKTGVSRSPGERKRRVDLGSSHPGTPPGRHSQLRCRVIYLHGLVRTLQ
ncbi:hypothetical protein F5B22DRAFT_595947 [Xylaria bambusicola]|uniref:uncharacterized protein n=1 Tax=Xylaria bambusicola TaxID=326684 RepID=UPI002008D848|nr:uncharacterized protein F5B22DRAFT_595947 [Xylaria bambusicola]KAI0521713.1 hypothetical protein F5B22DRAFT_595947 [Xylaria bambusicola]